jgi:cytoskeletal protein RodZ
MSPVRRGLLLAFVAALGIALAAAITWGTSQLVRQRIGLASEPLTAGSRLLAPSTSTSTTTPQARTSTSSQSVRTSSTTTSTQNATPTQTSAAPSSPETEASPSIPSSPTSSQSEEKRGSGGGDGRSHGDD